LYSLARSTDSPRRAASLAEYGARLTGLAFAILVSCGGYGHKTVLADTTGPVEIQVPAVPVTDAMHR
jgi:hypothetical protein